MKKLTCALLALVMVLGLFVGCNTEKPVETKPVETKPAETKPAETQPGETTPPVTEWTEEGYLPFANGEKLTIGTSESSVVDNYNTNPMTVWLEEVTGVDIEFVFFPGSSGDRRQKFALMVGGGEELPDIVMNAIKLSTQEINEYGEDGYLVDLQDYIGDMNYTPYLTQQLENISDVLYTRIMAKIKNPETGAIYQTPWASDVVAYDNTQTIGWINKTWLDQLGMEIPTTVDELHDVLVAFRDNDLNGNGKNDEIPLIGPVDTGGANILGLIINAYIYMDFDYHFNATDGALWTPWTNDAYREALKTLSAWYKEGLIAHQTYVGIDYEETKPIYTPEDGVALCGVMAGHPSVYMNAGSEVFYQYVPIAPLEGVTDLGGYMVNRPSAVYDGCVITTDCENVELALRFLDFLYADTSVATVNWGTEGVYWEWNDPTNTDSAVKNIKVLGDCHAERRWNWGYGTAISTNNNYMSAHTGEGWDGYRNQCQFQIEDWMASANVPEERVFNFLFTAEQQENYNTKAQRFTDYIKEGLAKFGSGVWDPNSDADWNTYLKELDTMGLKDYLDTAQAGYDAFNAAYSE